jgi:hypothetical protein
MAEENGLETLLRQLPVEQAGEDLVPSVHAALAAARRRARFVTNALRTGIGFLSLTTAVVLVPRLIALLALMPSEWASSAANWWTGLETAPVESLKALALQLWSIPITLAQSLGIELVLAGLVALFLSWLTFKIILAGQVSRKAVLQ